MGVEMKEKLAPNWILDRRDSGRLFWRRDSAGIPAENGSAVNRVKFRCDVEILEFLKSDDENIEELSSSDDYDSDDEYGWGGHGWKVRNKEEMPPPSSLVGGLCIIVIIAVLTYQWLYSNSKTLK